MRRSSLVLVCVLALCAGAVACQKIDRRVPTPGNLTFEPVPFDDAIPSEYGRLVGVTQHPATPHEATLWFTKEDDSIVMLRVNFSLGDMSQNALAIPRR